MYQTKAVKAERTLCAFFSAISEQAFLDRRVVSRHNGGVGLLAHRLREL